MSVPPPPTPDPNVSALMSQVYQQLRALARRRLQDEKPGHTLQATALVHEVFLRLAKTDAAFSGSAQFYHAAALAMRRILIEHARKRGRAKRGGGAKKAPIDVLDLAAAGNSEEILALDEAIGRLEALTPRAGEVVRLRFYAGLGPEETAKALGVSVRSVHREWAYARAWLYRALYGDA